jgi:hypothetical protein
LQAITIPETPIAGKPTIIRITHSNGYGPVDEADIFVRVGDPANPTEQDDVKSHTDWVKANLVEELVFVDDEEIPRSQADEPFEDETPWWGTYEAQLTLPAGKRLIEIKILSRQPDILRSLVLADWEIAVK